MISQLEKKIIFRYLKPKKKEGFINIIFLSKSLKPVLKNDLIWKVFCLGNDPIRVSSAVEKIKVILSSIFK